MLGKWFDSSLIIATVFFPDLLSSMLRIIMAIAVWVGSFVFHLNADIVFSYWKFQNNN